MMNYRVVGRKNPLTKKLKYYPALTAVTPIGAAQVIARIEKKCTLASADVKAVLDALETELIDCLQLGMSIRFGDLGSFRPSVRSSGSLTQEDVTAANIKSVHVVFTPSVGLRKAMNVRKGVVRFTKQVENAPGEQPAAGVGG